MVNGLGVLGWGVGGIEAEAAMLGQPLSMLIPQVVGFRLHGKLREGSTATDLVLHGHRRCCARRASSGSSSSSSAPGLAALSLADRATIANMAPEYGATCGIFPVDDETLRYLRLTGAAGRQIELVEAYRKEQGMFHSTATPEAEYTERLELDLGDVEPSVAGPKRPQDRVSLSRRAKSFDDALPSLTKPKKKTPARRSLRSTATTSDRLRARVGAVARREARLGRHRGDHELHQHVEPVGDGRGRPAREEGGRDGPVDQAVGEDVAGAGLEGGHRVPRRGRADAVPRAAAVPHRRLRLHDLHRQLGPAAAADLRRDRGRAIWSSPACCRATATSRGASTPTCAPTT